MADVADCLNFNVYIEGNISCGKSNLQQYLVDKCLNNNIYVLPEPLKNWQDWNGENLFAKYHDDLKKYSFPFQMYSMLTMFEREEMYSKKPIRLFERSIYSGIKCFSEVLVKLDKMNSIELTILKHFFEYFELQMHTNCDLIIYTRSNPACAFERIQARGRKEERNISLSFLSLLHFEYEQWLTSQSTFKVIIVDAEADMCKLKNSYDFCLKMIESLYERKKQLFKKQVQNDLLSTIPEIQNLQLNNETDNYE